MIGAFDLKREGPERKLVLVTVAQDARTKAIQDGLRFFQLDTAKHQITYEEGFPKGYLAIRFATPGTGIGAVRIMTYPGGLLYTGDMGSFVFERYGTNVDMLAWWPGSASAYIKEKCQAGECEEYSAEQARQSLSEWVYEAAEEADEHDDVSGRAAAIAETIDRMLLLSSLDTADGYFTVCSELDIDEPSSPMIPTLRFIWACEALKVVAEDWRAKWKAGTL